MMVIEYNNDRRKQNLRLDIYGGIYIYPGNRILDWIMVPITVGFMVDTLSTVELSCWFKK